jgi:ACS family glucarate transporter-like MFS transporter
MADAPPPPRPHRLVGLLSLISFIGYPLRTNITVAAKQMMPALGLTQVQMGNIFSSFQIFYALFQIPAGLLGDRIGARRALTIALVVWAVSSVLTGVVPASLGAGATIAFLYLARALLGVGEAATYPVGAMAIQREVPPGFRARANGLFIAAAAAGSALTPPLIAWGMTRAGWRATFVIAGLLALGVAVVWHRGSASPSAQVESPPPAALGAYLRASLALLKDRDLLLVSLSYMCQAAVWFLFVYWFYLYLTDVRGFSVLKGGVFGALPYVAAALIGPLGGAVTDTLSRRRGRAFGRRTAAVIGLLGSALCVVIGARLANPYLAILALSLSSGLVNFVEAPFWTTATELGGERAGMAGGILNTLGNLGGVFSTLAVPRLVEAWGWTASMAIFGGIAALAAALWFAITPERSSPSPTP